MPRISAACEGKKKGTKKEVVAEGILREDYGFVADVELCCH